MDPATRENAKSSVASFEGVYGIDEEMLRNPHGLFSVGRFHELRVSLHDNDVVDSVHRRATAGGT
jgi:hypothetical protein